MAKKNQGLVKITPAGYALMAGMLAGGSPAPTKGVPRPTTPPPPGTFGVPGNAPGQSSPAAGASPFIPDPQYLAAAAQDAFDRGTQVNALTQQNTDDSTNTQTAISRLLAGVPDALEGIDVGANKQGLFYSGQLTKRRGDYQSAVDQQHGDLATGLQQRTGARNAQITAIQQGAPINNSVLLADSAGRSVVGDTGAADANSLVPNVAAPAAQPTIRQTATQKLIQSRGPITQTLPAPGGVIHVHADGSRIFVARKK